MAELGRTARIGRALIESKEIAMTVLEPAAQAFADAAAQPPFMFQLPLATGRAKLVELQSTGVDKPDVETTDLFVDTSPSHRVPVRVVRPRDTKGDLPVILYLHAGWAFGDVVTHDRLVRELATGVDAAVVFPSFSLSPEAQYPTALEEIYAVAEWIDGEGPRLGLDSSRIAIAGDSAGGNMATAITIMAKQRGGPRFVHQMLLYPTLDASFDTPSYLEFATGFNVRRDHMQWLWDQYVPDAAQRTEITAAPLRAVVEDLVGLPPATIITAEVDVVRDDGEAYSEKLRQAGVPVTGVRYLGTIHDFMFLDALKSTEAARAGVAQAIDSLQTSFRTA
jgi:acetyl esterase/lipase